MDRRKLAIKITLPLTMLMTVLNSKVVSKTANYLMPRYPNQLHAHEKLP